MASNEARKKEARLYQNQHPGTPYPEARRAASRSRDLTAVIGTDRRGAGVQINLEEPAACGVGPHCLITGPVESGKTTLLAVMARSMLSTAPRRGLELVLSTGVPSPLFDDLATGPGASAKVRQGIRSIAPAKLFESYLRELLEDRAARLSERGWADNLGGGVSSAKRLPAVVVMVDHYHWGHFQVPGPDTVLAQAFMQGRALDVHLVITKVDAPPAQRHVPSQFQPYVESVISFGGGQRGHGTWCQDGESTDIAVAPEMLREEGHAHVNEQSDSGGSRDRRTGDRPSLGE